MQNLTSIIDAIGWALLSSLWQSSVIAMILFVILRLFAKSRPRFAYAFSYLMLVLCVSLPIVSVVQSLTMTVDTEVTSSMTVATFSVVETARAGFSLKGFVASYLREIVILWFSIVCLLGLRLMLGLAWLQCLTGIQHPHQTKLQTLADQLAARFELSVAVAVRVVDGLTGPVTMGFIKPVILMPAAMISKMDVQLIEALIAHELAHIKRFDYLFNFLQNFIEIILFYHPAVWWISKQIRKERENIADDIAANVLGEPRRLALALQELELFQFSQTQIALGANGGELMSRISRLIRPQNQSLGWKAMLSSVAIVSASLALASHARNVPLNQNDPQHGSSVVAMKAVDNNAQRPATLAQQEMNEAEGGGVRPVQSDSMVLESKDSAGANLKSPARNDTSNSHEIELPNAASMPFFEKKSEAVEGGSTKLIDPKTGGDEGKVFEFKSARVDLNNPSCSPSVPATTIKIIPSGLTIVKAFVGEKGNILRVSTVKSSGFVELDDAVKHALLKGECKGTPAMVNGRSFAAEASLSVNWDEIARRPSASSESLTLMPEDSQTRPAIVQLGAAECPLEYPRASQRNQEEGITEAQVSISAEGKILNVRILRSSGFRGLDIALQATLQSGICKASPSIVNGQAVASTIELAHVWKLTKTN